MRCSLCPRVTTAIIFERMCDMSIDLGEPNAPELIDAAREWSRAENAAAAAKLAVMAEIFTRRTGGDATDREDWWVDPDAAVATELAAALGVTRGLALAQTHRGVVLRDRLPQVGALFAAGELSDLTVRKIIHRTGLITDLAVMAAVDTDLDHTVPYPVGPTHASNLKALCRFQRVLGEVRFRRDSIKSCGLPAHFVGPDRSAARRSASARGLSQAVRRPRLACRRVCRQRRERIVW